MEEQLSTSSILLNVVIQVVNLLIFFFAFKYFLGDKVTKALEERNRLTDKLKNAEQEYHRIIDDAKRRSDIMVADATEKQRAIIKEHELVLGKQKQSILDDAHRKSQDIVLNASLQAKKIEKELEEQREESVKHASRSVVKKIIGNDDQLKDAYLTSLVKEVHH